MPIGPSGHSARQRLFRAARSGPAWLGPAARPVDNQPLAGPATTPAHGVFPGTRTRMPRSELAGTRARMSDSTRLCTRVQSQVDFFLLAGLPGCVWALISGARCGTLMRNTSPAALRLELPFGPRPGQFSVSKFCKAGQLEPGPGVAPGACPPRLPRSRGMAAAPAVRSLRHCGHGPTVAAQSSSESGESLPGDLHRQRLRA